MPPYPSSITEWAEQVNAHLTHLSRPQAWVLALWSYGAQVLHSCGQSQVAGLLAQLLGQRTDTVRQRLREWAWDKEAKKGQHRQELVVTRCFADLLHWVVSGLNTDERRLAVALDATTLKLDFVVLTVSVLYRGCAIPVAWQVLRATQPGSWRPHWLALLEHLAGQVPPDWQVLVLADRGLFAHWLFAAIQANGWHPFLRINVDGKCRPEGSSEFRPLLSLLPASGQVWRGRVTCFKNRPLAASLLAWCDAAHTQPWLILTDLAPEAAQVAWYGLRAWIEAQFKDLKGGGWQWQRTRMTQPERVSRMWLVLALAMLLAVSLGSQVEAQQPASLLAELPATHIARRTATGQPAHRRLSLVTLGYLAFLAALIWARPSPYVAFHAPNPWPAYP
jgi:hypothetical protein